MKQVYNQFWDWEDYLHGMYLIPTEISQEDIQKGVKLLSNQKEFFDTALKMIKDWRFSADENLSKKSINRRAWIGQASCCYKYRLPEIITRQSWANMSSLDKNLANQTADKIIKIYEERHNELYKEVGGEMLF